MYFSPFQHRILLLFLLFSTPICFLGQDLIEKEFGSDFSMSITDVVEVGDGFLMTGFGSQSINDSSMAFLMKTDMDLDIAWTKRYKALLKDDFTDILSLSDGNFLVAGASRQNSVFQNGAQFYKIDGSGNILWAKSFTSSGSWRMLEMFEESDGTLTFFIRHGVTGQSTKIVHTDATGNIITVRAYEIDNFGVFADEIVKGDGGTYYLSGTFYNFPEDIQEVFICAIDASSVLWYKRFHFDRTVNVFGLEYDGGELILCGTIIDTENILFRNNYALKVDFEGTVISSKEYKKTAFDQWLTFAFKTSDNKTYQLGFTNDLVEIEATLFNIQNDLTSNNLKTFGAFESQKLFFGMELQDQRLLLLGTNDNGLYLLLTDQNGESACSSESYEMVTSDLSVTTESFIPEFEEIIMESEIVAVVLSDLLITASEYCSGTIDIKELSDSKVIKVFPNPSKGTFQIEVQNSNRIQVVSINGDVLLEQIIPENQDKLTLDLSHFESGVYFLWSFSDSKVISTKIVVY